MHAVGEPVQAKKTVGALGSDSQLAAGDLLLDLHLDWREGAVIHLDEHRCFS